LNSEQTDWRRKQSEDLTLRKFFLAKEGRPDWQEIVSEDDSAKIYSVGVSCYREWHSLHEMGDS